jgi:hypothetical protein
MEGFKKKKLYGHSEQKKKMAWNEEVHSKNGNGQKKDGVKRRSSFEKR